MGCGEQSRGQGVAGDLHEVRGEQHTAVALPFAVNERPHLPTRLWVHAFAIGRGGVSDGVMFWAV